MRIEDWLQGFLTRLMQSFPPADWPDVDAESYDVFYEDFRKAFARNGVSEQEAEEARSLLAENPPRFRADYIPKVVGAVKIFRELSPATDGLDGSMDDRESALHASRTCIRCFGEGLALVYASRPSDAQRIPFSTVSYCTCPYGQWVEKTHREKSPDVWKRIPHLSNVLAGRSFWRLDPPGYEGLSEQNRPADGAGDLIRRWTGAVGVETNAAKASPAKASPAKARPEWMAVREARTTPTLPSTPEPGDPS